MIVDRHLRVASYMVERAGYVVHHHGLVGNMLSVDESFTVVAVLVNANTYNNGNDNNGCDCSYLGSEPSLAGLQFAVGYSYLAQCGKIRLQFRLFGIAISRGKEVVELLFLVK